MGWLGDGSHRGQLRHAWTAAALPCKLLAACHPPVFQCMLNSSSMYSRIRSLCFQYPKSWHFTYDACDMLSRKNRIFPAHIVSYRIYVYTQRRWLKDNKYIKSHKYNMICQWLEIMLRQAAAISTDQPVICAKYHSPHSQGRSNHSVLHK